MKGILWCNGVLPSKSVLDRFLTHGVPIFGVDGGADKALSMGYEIYEVLGDMDSVDSSIWEGKMTLLMDQDRSDLSKSLEYIEGIGITDVDIVGAEGGDHGHVIGSIASLTDAPEGMKVRIHYESGVIHLVSPTNDGFNQRMRVRQKFSVFALTECERASVLGSRWELDNESLSFSTKGLGNEGLGGVVSVRADGLIAVFVSA